MKRLSLILTLCILCISIGFAQKPKNVRYHIETTVDSLLWDLNLFQKQRINQLTADSSKLENAISELNKELSNCKQQIQNDSTTIAKLNKEISDYKKSVSDYKRIVNEKDSEVKRMQKEMAAISDRADSAYVKVAKSYIYTRYVKGDIDFAISSLQQIKNQKISKAYEGLRQILTMYEKFNEDFLNILNEAQNDEDRNSRGIVDNAQKFANKYLERIKSMDYYKNYYKQYWSIKYLDDKIDESIALLENHKIALKKVDLSGIIKELK